MEDGNSFVGEELPDVVDRMTYLRGGTKIGQALRHALQRELIQSRGDRPNVKTVVIVITDGRSEDDPKRPADQLRARGFTLISIGVEGEGHHGGFAPNQPGLDNGQLLSIAGSRDRTFKVCNFNRLDQNVKNAIAAQICSEGDKCRMAESDVIFLVDGSGSIGSENFRRVKEFLKLMVDSMEVGLTRTRVGVVQFNDQAFTELPLHQSFNSDVIKRALDRISWRHGKTKVGKALSHIMTREFNEESGDRESVGNVVVVLTDGRSEDDPRYPADQLRSGGVKTVVIGITDQTDQQQLNAIAGEPEAVFTVRDFSRLNRRLKNAITSQICKGDSNNGIDSSGPSVLKYLGCFQDVNPRIFPKQLSNNFTQTAENCGQRCRAEGFPISGTQLGYECHCSSYDQLQNAQKLDDRRCIYNCPGDPTGDFKCGAYYVMSAYEIGRGNSGEVDPDLEKEEFEYLGCFQEIVPRKLPKFVLGPVLQTPKTCLDACMAEGLDHAGLQLASQCWCGDSGGLAEMDRLPDDKCNYKCVGDTNAVCGGLLIASVYKTKCKDEGRCRNARLDLLMLVDGGSSVGRLNFDHIKRFLQAMVDLYDVQNDQARIGMVQFSEHPYTEFALNQYRSSDKIKSAITRVPWRRGAGRRIGAALDYVIRNELVHQRGDRLHAPTLILLLVDGRSKDGFIGAVRRLQNRMVKIFTIGLTDKVDVGYLRTISGNRECALKVPTYDQLNGHLRREIATTICHEDFEQLGTGQTEEEELEYVGCFKESIPRQMPQFVVGEVQQTPKTCVDACVAEGKDTAGIFAGSQCWCGNRTSLKERNKEVESSCDFYKCIGDKSAPCGGLGFVMAVYQYKMKQPLTWSNWSPTPQPWNQWGTWSQLHTTQRPWTGNWESWSGQWSQWQSWNAGHNQAGGPNRERRKEFLPIKITQDKLAYLTVCEMDAVVMTDWSIPTGRFFEDMTNVAEAISKLKSNNYPVAFAVTTVDRDRHLKLLHGFNDDQSYQNIRHVLMHSQHLSGRDQWETVRDRMMRSGDGRHKVVIYVVGRDSPGSELTAAANTLISRGVTIVPVYYGRKDISQTTAELKALVGANRNLILNNPTSDQIVEAVKCKNR